MMYPWQQQQWQQVLQQHRQQRLSQALLLSGVDGLGQFEFAKAVAQLLLCERPSEQPCHQCRHCHLLRSGTHPDFYCLEAVAPSRVIKIEQVRQLIDQVAQTPHLAKAQIVIINTLDVMNSKASNALLKTLEEPSGQVFFILICHRLGLVPPTILSRTQALHFFVNDEEQAIHWLYQQLPDESMSTLLRIADYAPLRALALAKRSILTLRDQLLQKLLSIAKEGNPIVGVEALLKHDFQDVLMLLRLLLMDIRKCQLGVATTYLTHSDCAADLNQLAPHYTVQRLQQQLDAVIQTDRVLREGIHINPQLALESVFLC